MLVELQVIAQNSDTNWFLPSRSKAKAKNSSKMVPFKSVRRKSLIWNGYKWQSWCSFTIYKNSKQIECSIRHFSKVLNNICLGKTIVLFSVNKAWLFFFIGLKCKISLCEKSLNIVHLSCSRMFNNLLIYFVSGPTCIDDCFNCKNLNSKNFNHEKNHKRLETRSQKD